MEPPPCLTVGTTQTGIIFSSALCKTKVRRFDPIISNLDSSVQRTFVESFSVQSRWVRAHCIRFFLFCGISSGFRSTARPNNLESLNCLFTLVNDTGLDRGLFTFGWICGAVRRLFNLLVMAMNLSSLALGLPDRERS